MFEADRSAATKGSHDAGYFVRTVRTSEGSISISHFEQCPLRMASARCNFYIPENSNKPHSEEIAEEHGPAGPVPGPPTMPLVRAWAQAEKLCGCPSDA